MRIGSFLKISAFLSVWMSSMLQVQSQGGDSNDGGNKSPMRLITLHPGHGHAAHIQKTMFKDIDPTVHIYAPEEPELRAHQDLIRQYNSRGNSPTSWKEKVYVGRDYLQQMLKEAPGSIVVVAGNNRRKSEYISAVINAKHHVLADKPMAINSSGFKSLLTAFATAEKNKVILYDIMTSRYVITNILQRELCQIPELFGNFITGSKTQPAIEMERVHYFLKYTNGNPQIRPGWYFDVTQQGEGIVDVTTHMVDLIQWLCFPEVILNFEKDITVLSARRWTTSLTPSQFSKITHIKTYPEFLKKNVKDTMLAVYANGAFTYKIKEIFASVKIGWNVESMEGRGDEHRSILRGTRANLVIKGDKEQSYKATLFIEATSPENKNLIQRSLPKILASIREKHPGITLKETGKGWEVIIPEKYTQRNEENYARVTEKFLQYIQQGSLPRWEVSGMISKYYTTTQALALALKNE